MAALHFLTFVAVLCTGVKLANCELSSAWNEFLGTEKNVFPPQLNSGILTKVNNPKLNASAAVLAQLSEMLENPRISKTIYANYLMEFGKAGRNFQKVFQKNVMLIAQRNLAYHDGRSSWSEGINQFTDMPEEELRGWYGLPEDFPQNFIDNSTFITSDSPDFPQDLAEYGQESSLDWRNHDGKSIVTRVKNQAGCGSCWAFSTIAPVESAILKAGKPQQILSEQNLVDCASKDGCAGEWPKVSLDYLKSKGVSTASDYPYTAREGQCQNKPVAIKVKSYIKSNKESEMKSLCAKYGPFSLSLYFHSDMHRMKTGVYDGECGHSSHGHAMAAVGYGNEDGKDFWIIKNSYGADWADKGYYKIIRGKNKCGIESYIGGYFVTI